MASFNAFPEDEYLIVHKILNHASYGELRDRGLIENRKRNKSDLFFLVRWSGFPPSRDSWEPLENVQALRIFRTYYRQTERLRRVLSVGKDGTYVTIYGRGRPKKKREERGDNATSALPQEGERSDADLTQIEALFFQNEPDKSSDGGIYEVERIIAREKNQFYIKWKGWPYSSSTWITKDSFLEMNEAIQEFYERENALAVFKKSPSQRIALHRLPQLHSLSQWEDEMNTVLDAAGMARLYVYNDVDNEFRAWNFTYITKSILPTLLTTSAGARVEESSSPCECKSRGCGNWRSCCVERGRQYKVAIVRTRRYGWGVFAVEEIPKETFVLECVGEVIPIEVADSCQDNNYQFELETNGGIQYAMDCKYFGNEGAFLNHSCRPNLKLVRVISEAIDPSIYRIAMVSIKRIGVGEQLSFNYFGKRPVGRPPRNVKCDGRAICLCGAGNCMKYWQNATAE